ncbi:MAG: hypothetical protein KME20_26140 [Kaiparowitsia implicata GSE-PSE-MK54-09C]|jgi:flagellar biosynthesis/type III secretory pathway M-ring protein FliF/YscJ|nr:hypothetical protein [Kaiparowitsia implicata GSE-PSE-MK54-09C]
MNRNFLNQLGDQAAVVGALAVLAFVLSALIAFFIVRDFKGKPDSATPSVQEQSQQEQSDRPGS